MTATTVSPARLLANQQNALKSSGPKTAEGKARSRANAVKHGLTGEGVALPAQDAAEVERLQRSLETELKPSGVLGRTLVRRMALMAVRMDRCVDQESAHLAERVRQALADFDAEWPEEEGEDIALRAKARLEAAQVALFDPSKEACLARKYEAAAERCFFRSLKELRQVEKEAKARDSGPAVGEAPANLGSFLPMDTLLKELDAMTPPPPAKPVVPVTNGRSKPVSGASTAPMTPMGGVFDVPFSIGRVG